MKRVVVAVGVVTLLGLGLGLARHHHQPSAQPAVSAQTQGDYVSLGDSVAAGQGLLTDSDSSACDRTNESYPNLIAKQLHYRLTSLACSGATTSTGLLGSQEVNQLTLPPQLDALKAIKQPKLISLTIGANDIDWTSLFGQCYTATCGSLADSAAVAAKLVTLSSNLHTALETIKADYPNPPTVIVTGYHQIFPAALTNCDGLASINNDELAWALGEQSQLNSTIKLAVTDFNFAHFTSINFAGHELCTDAPWVQDFAANAPFHPTAAGEQAYAKAIEATIKTIGAK